MIWPQGIFGTAQQCTCTRNPQSRLRAQATLTATTSRPNAGQQAQSSTHQWQSSTHQWQSSTHQWQSSTHQWQSSTHQWQSSTHQWQSDAHKHDVLDLQPPAAAPKQQHMGRGHSRRWQGQAFGPHKHMLASLPQRQRAPQSTGGREEQGSRGRRRRCWGRPLGWMQAQAGACVNHGLAEGAKQDIAGSGACSSPPALHVTMRSVQRGCR